LSWVRWSGPAADTEEADQPHLPTSSESLASIALSRASHADWAQLLEQASDLNDELCRENCELHTELAVLRQRQAVLGGVPEGQDPETWRKNRAKRAARILPHLAASVQKAMMDVKPVTDVEMPVEMLVTETQRALVTAASSGGDPLASSEETSALVLEKVRLKELSLLQQERLLELELAREKLTGSSQGHWASRLTSALQPKPSRDEAVPATGIPSSAGATLASVSQGLEQTPPMESVSAVVGEEYVVVGRNGAILRESEELDSAQVVTIPPGHRICILEIGSASSRRARVCAIGPLPSAPAEDNTDDMPPMGWLSVMTKDGKALIRPSEDRRAEAVSQSLTPSPIDSAAVQHDSAAPSSAPDKGHELDPSSESVQGSQERVDTPAAEKKGKSPDPSLLEQAEALWAATAPATAETKPLPTILPAVDESSTSKVRSSTDAVVVSTDAWLSLRNERMLRERQIKALDAQVKAAQRDLEHIVQMRATLRDQRARTLELRQDGSRLEERARMTAEEICMLSMRVAEMVQQIQRHKSSEGVGMSTDATANVAEAGSEHREQLSATGLPLTLTSDSAASGSATNSKTLGYLPSASSCSDRMAAQSVAQSVEWRRIVAERETTAWELGQQLRQVEEMESLVDERRVELQAAEKRRERERRSLLTALKELGGRNSQGSAGRDDVQDAPFQQPPPPPPPPSDGASSGETKECAFLQKISELEDLIGTMEAKLDLLQARAAALNKSATVRSEALNYATVAKQAQFWVAELFLPEELPRRRSPDLEGLAVMLEGLFVENFQLLQVQKAKSKNASSSRSGPAGPTGVDVDLTPFIINGSGSETRSPSPDPDRRERQARPPPPVAAGGSVTPQSPRALRKRLGGLDFNHLSVAE